MVEFFRKLFDLKDFMPRRYCGHWTRGLVLLHNASDLVIWLSYVAIPVILITFARRRDDLPFPWIFVLFGAFIAPAYNLEWFGGRFHTNLWLAISWAAFATFTGWWVNALGVHSVGEAVAVVGVVVGTAFLVTAQRRLSTPVRELRRRTVELTGTQRLADGTVRELTREDLAAPLDGALRALAIAVPLVAIGLLAARI